MRTTKMSNLNWELLVAHAKRACFSSNQYASVGCVASQSTDRCVSAMQAFLGVRDALDTSFVGLRDGRLQPDGLTA